MCRSPAIVNWTEPLYQRALAIREQALGPNHPNTKAGHENYANLLESMKRKKK
jgi:hypothetical protein